MFGDADVNLAAPSRIVLTSTYETERGITVFEPGTTYGPIIGSLLVVAGGTVPADTQLTLAIGLFPSTMDDIDLGPLSNPHLDWMGRWTFFIDASASLRLDGTSGERLHVGSRRRSRSIQDRLVLCAEAETDTGTIRISGETSTLIALP